MRYRRICSLISQEWSNAWSCDIRKLPALAIPPLSQAAWFFFFVSRHKILISDGVFFVVQGSVLVLLAVTSWCSNDVLFTCVISEYWRHRTRVCQFRHILLSDWESSSPVCSALLLLFVQPCEVFRASYAYWTSTQEHSSPWFIVKLTFHYEDAGQAVGWTWCVVECQHKHRRLTTVPLRLVPPWSSRISELLLITVQWLLQVKCTLLSVIHLPPDTVESPPRRLLHTLAQPRISRYFHENLADLDHFPYLSWFVSSNNQTRTIEAFLYLMTWHTPSYTHPDSTKYFQNTHFRSNLNQICSQQ